MSTYDDLDVEVELRVWDTENNSRSVNYGDEYTLVVRNGSVAYNARFYRERPRPLEIAIRSEDLTLDDIPSNIAAAMQEHVDDSMINWPTSHGVGQGSVERREIIITVTEIQEDSEGEEHEGKTYKFYVYNTDYAEIGRDGDKVESTKVPPGILHEAEQYIPSGVDYLDE